MEYRQNNNNVPFIDSMFETEPHINVIDKDRFNDRVQTVYNILYNSLVKSFGPGGAGTFISVYPNYYNTKDGFTIMKNLAFDKKLDQVISDMVMNICSRLNFTVGDGTTTAVIATRSIYNSYYKQSKENKYDYLPRTILKKLDIIKNDILKNIDERAIPIRSDDPEVLKENIRKVVYISSNGNDELTNMISDLYGKLMYPTISCEISKDGTTSSSIVEGYKIDVCLTDKIYINNDNNTMVLNGANVIMFDHKVTKATYEKILKPLSMSSKMRGKHLICISPYYDEVALQGVIRANLMSEYKNTQDVNLVLCVCSKVNASARTRLDDLSMLLNTPLISNATEMELIEKIDGGKYDYDLFDMDNRGIVGLPIAVMSTVEEGKLSLIPYEEGLEKTHNIFCANIVKDTLRLGYADQITLGLKESTFSGFYYDETLYKKYYNTAKEELEEIQNKVEKNGTFSFDLIDKQKRLYSLNLKTGIIEIGASSEMTQGYLKDTVDDAIKAASSAFNNGIVLGCNVTLLQIVDEMIRSGKYDQDTWLLEIIYNGFKDVYKSVLNNVINDEVNYREAYQDENIKFTSAFTDKITKIYQGKLGSEYEFNFSDSLDIIKGTIPTEEVSLFNDIIKISINSGKVFDVSIGEFTKDVINSAATDKEVLKATIDLLSLLITGNQMVLQ